MLPKQANPLIFIIFFVALSILLKVQEYGRSVSWLHLFHALYNHDDISGCDYLHFGVFAAGWVYLYLKLEFLLLQHSAVQFSCSYRLSFCTALTSVFYLQFLTTVSIQLIFLVPNSCYILVLIDHSDILLSFNIDCLLWCRMYSSMTLIWLLRMLTSAIHTCYLF